MVSKVVDPIVEKIFASVENRAALARHLGAHPQALYLWRRVPPKFVIGVEKYLKKSITRHEMRPDIYPLDES